MMPMCWRLGTWFRTIGRLLKGLSLRLPMDVSLPEAIQKLDIRVKGKERIIAPSAKAGTASFWNNTGEFERVPAQEVENWVHTAQ